ncbi:MAG: hypothetical protein H7287_05515 [Thermoleophilia bacterium]|nr:hypothetical protein [Thermoleophilia bacterium]
MPEAPHDIDIWLRHALAVEASSPDVRAAGWKQVRERHHESRRTGNRRLSRAHRPGRALLVAVAAVLVVGSSAFAATGPIREFFDDDAPVTEQVDQFRTTVSVEHALPMTADEYADMSANNVMPKPDAPLGDLRPDQTQEIMPFASRKRSRVIVDDPLVGRLVAVPSPDGTRICTSYHPPKGILEIEAGSGGCFGELPTSGMTLGVVHFGKPGAMTTMVHGMTADNVTRIQVELADQARVDVPLVNNVFFWTNKEHPEDDPVLVIATRHGHEYMELVGPH